MEVQTLLEAFDDVILEDLPTKLPPMCNIQCNTPKYTLVVFSMFRVFCRYNLKFS